jgi:hypothetical protein
MQQSSRFSEKIFDPIAEKTKTSCSNDNVFYLPVHQKDGDRPGIDAVDEFVRSAEIARLKTELVFRQIVVDRLRILIRQGQYGNALTPE